jgi:hypothetical protein
MRRRPLAGTGQYKQVDDRFAGRRVLNDRRLRDDLGNPQTADRLILERGH